MSELQVGERYLSGKMRTSKALEKVMEAIRDNKVEFDIAAFPVKNREGNQPNYKGDFSCWVNTKKEKVEEVL